MRRYRRSLTRLLPLVMLASLLTLVGTTAQAVTQVWSNPLQITGMAGASALMTTPTGDVVMSCTAWNRPGSIATVTAVGTHSSTILHLNSNGRDPDACEGTVAVSADGTIYTQAASTTNNARYIVAYKNGAELWTRALTTSCANVWSYPSSVMLGHNGNVYAVVGSQGQCAASGTRLMGLNPSTGAVLFDVGLGNTQSGVRNGLQVHANGLALLWGNQFRFFDYSGSEQPNPVNIALAPGEGVVDVAGGLGGTVFAMVVKNQSTTPSCPYSQVASRVLAFNPSGQTWQYMITNCQKYRMFRSTPSNGVVLDTTNSLDIDEISAISGSGAPLWAQPYVPDTGDDDLHVFGDWRHSTIDVDNNGNVLVKQYYHSPTNQFIGAQISIVDGAAGTRRSVIYTEELYPGMTFNSVNLGMSPSRLYLSANVCSTTSCSSGDPYLYALEVPGLGMDFPRAAALGQTSQPPAAELKYVALGDSFSSGEGVPPFDEGTDVGPAEDDFNMCHRSTRAYARLLDGDPNLSVRLMASFACSGATTTNIINTYQYDNQPPQSLLLNSGIDVVTVSIGGNDVGFASFARSCVESSCEGTSYNTIVDYINNNLPGVLDAAYAAIKAKVSTSTRIVVVGYPQLIPSPSVATTWPFCSYLTATEKTNARSVVSLINEATQDAVDRAGSQFVFADPTAAGSPFVGHELCNDGSYFNGVTVQDSVPYWTAYSFHPNADGQRAYWQIVRQQMS